MTPSTAAPASDRAALARATIAAARAVPGVADVGAGPWGRLCTYHGAGRIDGVRLAGSGGSGVRTTVGIHVSHGTHIPSVAEAVRAAVAEATGDVVDVAVVDVVVGATPPDHADASPDRPRSSS